MIEAGLMFSQLHLSEANTPVRTKSHPPVAGDEAEVSSGA